MSSGNVTMSRLLKRRRVDPDAQPRVFADQYPGGTGVSYGSEVVPAGAPGSVPEVAIRTWDDSSIVTGSNRPPLVCSERLQSTNLIINSNNRIFGDPFTFTVNCGGSLQRGRVVTLYRALVPKIPNITPLNNTFVLNHATIGTLTVTIPAPGFYTTTDFANELVYQLDTAAAAADTFTVTFDSRTETFTLSSVGGNVISVDATCSFHARGANFAQFLGSGTSITSTKVGLLYTRYITVSSSRIDRYSVAPTLLSADNLPAGDIIAVIDTGSLHTPADFDITTPFAGCFVSVDTPEAPFIRIANDAREFNTTGIDITTTDEYGFDLQQAFGSTNTQGLVLFFSVEF